MVAEKKAEHQTVNKGGLVTVDHCWGFWESSENVFTFVVSS